MLSLHRIAPQGFFFRGKIRCTSAARSWFVPSAAVPRQLASLRLFRTMSRTLCCLPVAMTCYVCWTRWRALSKRTVNCICWIRVWCLVTSLFLKCLYHQNGNVQAVIINNNNSHLYLESTWLIAIARSPRRNSPWVPCILPWQQDCRRSATAAKCDPKRCHHRSLKFIAWINWIQEGWPENKKWREFQANNLIRELEDWDKWQAVQVSRMGG